MEAGGAELVPLLQTFLSEPFVKRNFTLNAVVAVVDAADWALDEAPARVTWIYNASLYNSAPLNGAPLYIAHHLMVHHYIS